MHISQDVENRASPNKKNSNSITNLNIYQNHLVRVLDIGLTWKLEFDVTMYKLPAFDQQWMNLFHLTRNGNADQDNMLKFNIWRDGLHGKFAFKYGKKTKQMLFALGTTYHVIIEQYKARRGEKYLFVITVDDEYLVNEFLKELPKSYNRVKLYSSNPWEKTLPSKVGKIKNFQMTTGKSTQCCRYIVVDIDKSFLSSSHAKLQKSLVGTYSYTGQKNQRGYWVNVDRTMAIWYYPQFREWMCGHIEYLGTKWRGISAGHTSVSCPSQNVQRWHYWNGSKWKVDLKSHIHLYCQENFVDYNKEKITPGIKKLYYLRKIYISRIGICTTKYFSCPQILKIFKNKKFESFFSGL